MLLLGILLMAALQAGEVRTAPTATAFPGPEGVTLVVEYGATAVLPCNASAYVEEGGEEDGEGAEEDGSPRWESTGADVAFLQGGELVEGRGYEGRVKLAGQENMREGDWSLVLDKVALGDAGVYECIQGGRRTVATVWLEVEDPVAERSVKVWLGDSVVLPCYADLPKDLPDESLNVWWFRNGHEIVSHKDQVALHEGGDAPRFTLWINRPQGDLSLIISPVLIYDHGDYSCVYRISDSEESKMGIPKSISLTVLGTEPTETETAAESTTVPTTESATATGQATTYAGTVFTENAPQTAAATATENTTEQPATEATACTVTTVHGVTATETVTVTDDPRTEKAADHTTETTSGSTWNGTDARTELGTVTGTTERIITMSTTHPTPLLLEDTTQPERAETTSQFYPMEALEEIVTLFPDEGEGKVDSTQWDNLPWVLIGVVAGAVVLAGVALCVLGALRQI